MWASLAPKLRELAQTAPVNLLRTAATRHQCLQVHVVPAWLTPLVPGARPYHGLFLKLQRSDAPMRASTPRIGPSAHGF